MRRLLVYTAHCQREALRLAVRTRLTKAISRQPSAGRHHTKAASVCTVCVAASSWRPSSSKSILR